LQETFPRAWGTAPSSTFENGERVAEERTRKVNVRLIQTTNRDRAWHGAIDRKWPALRKALLAWHDPANFDGDGRQRTRLSTIHFAP
jgi:hypothetical protein